MKKILIAFFAFVICFSLCGVCRAQEDPSDVQSGAVETGEIDFEEYITEKILPVIIGVATSSFGFVAVLGAVSRSLKSLKDTKESFLAEAKERKESFEEGKRALEEKARELGELVKDVPELSGRLNELREECELLAQILTLGFSANSEIIKSGKGKKMAVLLENVKLKSLPQSPAVTALHKARHEGAPSGGALKEQDAKEMR